MIKQLFAILVSFFLSVNLLLGQENHAMYLMHYLPESNLLNPAVSIPCKWYVGIPVLSSIHLNYSNNAFTYKQLFSTTGQGTQQIEIDNVVNQLHNRNYAGTQIHTQLFALGYRERGFSAVFTITEKNNIPVTYPRDAAKLLWEGNTQFEGETAGLKGTGVYFNHYREYALSASKKTMSGFILGARAKVLFGKLNMSAKSTDISVTTDETTFDLQFEGDLVINTSLPIVASASNNQLDELSYDESTDWLKLALSRKNPGFAIDAGFIYPYSEKLTVSGSVLDLGFIRWRSNLNTFDGSGDFTYRGVEGSIIPTDDYFDHLLDTIMESMQFEVYQKKYTTFLPPKLLLGADYRLNKYISAGLIADATIHRSKALSALTVTAQVYPVRNVQAIFSYTAKNFSFNQFGAGVVIGRSPVQFYVMSDNILAFNNLLTTRLVNLRFGLNLNLGCSQKSKKSRTNNKAMVPGNCTSLEKQNLKNYKLKQRKKKR